MAAAIRDLKLWQESVALAGEVVRTLRTTNRREVKAVVELVMTTAVGVATLITDGYARYEAVEQQEVYTAARRELLRLETQLAIARRADLVTVAAEADLAARAQSVARLLVGYLAYLDRQIADRSASVGSRAARAASDDARSTSDGLTPTG